MIDAKNCPKNTEAERSARCGGLWRKTSFGTHSERVTRFIERVTTTAETVSRQGGTVKASLQETLCDIIRGIEISMLLPN